MTSKQLSIFDPPPANDNLYHFGAKPIRVLKAQNGDIEFIASEVCAAVGVSNVSDVLKRLDPEDKHEIDSFDVMGRKVKIAAVTEMGMYEIVIRSDKPQAKKFRRWITHEVLPQIRRTGMYIPEPARPKIMPPRSHIEKTTYAVGVVNHHQTHEQAIQRVEERRTGIDALKQMKATLYELVTIGGKINFGAAMNAEYMGLFGVFAEQLKALSGTDNVRDGLTDLQLQYLRTAEMTINEALKQAGHMTPAKAMDLIRFISGYLGVLLKNVDGS